MSENFLELDIPARDLHIRVKHWHPDATHNVIALHGWLDNAASFDVLAPLLPSCSIAAIDLAGQGFSGHRPPSATYHLWDDLIDILEVADCLGWQQFSLIGHSRGAMLAVMLAASCPQRVENMVLLDGLMPLPVAIQDAPRQLRQFLDGSRKKRDHRLFDSREQAIAVRARAGSVPESVAEILASRQLRQCEQGWYWHIDERLKAASAMKMSVEHNRAFLQAVACPVTVVLAKKGWADNDEMQQIRSAYPHFDWQLVEGHHHLHMDKQAREVAALCLNAFSR